MRWWGSAVACAILIAASTAHGGQNRPLQLRHGLAQLRDEAQQVRLSGEIPEEPDFAERFTGRVTQREWQDALLRRQDGDAFVDAYVRWQLTSFDFELTLNSADFRRMLRNAPLMQHNPRAHPDALELLELAAASGPLLASDLERLRQFSAELDDATALAEAFNRPAMEFRHWVRSHLGDTGIRRLQWMVEECAATIDAGWSTRAVKYRMSVSFTASVEDSTILMAERRMLAEQVSLLAGRERRFVNTITFMADGTVNITYSNARVTQRDVDAWIERLAGLR